MGLNNLVRAGKVLYLGVSDTPAWIVSKANQYARDHGLAQFVIYQVRRSVKGPTDVSGQVERHRPHIRA